jgi:hypothetical protein
MKFYKLLSGTLLILGVVAIAVYAGATKYVKVRVPFANIYEYLDPQSTILRQVSQNKYFELVYEGTSWYQVKVENKVGWLEKSAGTIIDSPGITVFSIPLGTLIFFLLLLATTIIGASLLIYKQKTAEL